MLGDSATPVLGNCKYTTGVIVDIAENDEGEQFALLFYTPRLKRWYPMWQLIPAGISWFTFRHLLFSFLKVFRKTLVLRADT